MHSSLIRQVAPVKFQPARFRGKWVDVNISQQITTAYEDGKPVKVTLCSTGKGVNETNLGSVEDLLALAQARYAGRQQGLRRLL